MVLGSKITGFFFRFNVCVRMNFKSLIRFYNELRVKYKFNSLFLLLKSKYEHVRAHMDVGVVVPI